MHQTSIIRQLRLKLNICHGRFFKISIPQITVMMKTKNDGPKQLLKILNATKLNVLVHNQGIFQFKISRYVCIHQTLILIGIK